MKTSLYRTIASVVFSCMLVLLTLQCTILPVSGANASHVTSIDIAKWEVALPVTLLLTLPTLSGFAWSVLVRLDLTLWFLVMLTFLAMTGIVRAVLVLRLLRRKDTDVRTEAPSPSANPHLA